MKILPVAYESFGVRSMATYVETTDLKIFIDPGVSVSPDRFSLPPHRLELDRRRERFEAVKKWATASDIIIITHYHYDHHTPDEECLYKNKDVFLKHPRESINYSQKQRAATFLESAERYTKSIHIADGKQYNFGKTSLIFSPPVFHGLSNRQGFVVEVLIEEKERFIYSSDVQGPLIDEAVLFIQEHAPHTVILDGPATYLVGSHYKKSHVNQAFRNCQKIIEETPVKNLIIDHHLLRDITWSDYINKLDQLKKNVKVCSAADYIGEKVEILEARRKELYQGHVCE